MKIPYLACSALAAALLSLPAELSAHGGTYRGPGDTVPPTSGGGGGKTGNPGTPSTPTPGTPSTPTPGTPNAPTPTSGGTPTAPPTAPTGGGGRGGPVTQGGGGVRLDNSLNQWQFWWEFNKDPFLQLKKAIQSGQVTSGSDDFLMGKGKKKDAKDLLAPSDKDRQKIIEALKETLVDKDSNRDIVSSCMVALAKIGGDASMLPLFKKFLPDNDQEKRETAALAMGIAAMKEAVPDLISLALDTEEGRQLCKRSSVDFRTRSFSCYGLGLIAHRTNDTEIQAKVFEAMREIADRPKGSTHRDLKVAALNAIRLLRPNAKEDGIALKDRVVEYLNAYTLKKDEHEYALIRSHAYTALASILGRQGDEKGVIKNRFAKQLRDRKEKSWIHQSAVLAIGQMARPEDTETIDSLQWYYSKGRDLQARNFSAIALGQIGGEKAKSFLYKTLKASRTQKLYKPWLALGLALMDYNIRAKDQNYDGDYTTGDAIHKEFQKNKSMFAAGLAIALGMMRFQDAGDDILARLEKYKNLDEEGGYMAVALGLLGYQDARDFINELVDRSSRRDQLLLQCSIALGLLGDKEISSKLLRKLEGKNVVLAVYSAFASALGFIGDRRSIDPLIRNLKNKSFRDLPRAFSAVALGLIGEKEMLPWNSKIAVNANYRANVETLTGSGTGILDIL